MLAVFEASLREQLHPKTDSKKQSSIVCCEPAKRIDQLLLLETPHAVAERADAGKNDHIGFR